MSDQPTNVRTFPGAELPEQTLLVERQPYNFCEHDKISLDEHRRVVKCSSCDKVYDPFDFLHKEAHRLDAAWRNYAHTRKELNELIERVDNLKKEEARLKARIKTAKSKVEPVVFTRSRAL